MTRSRYDPFEGLEGIDEALLRGAREVWDSRMYASVCTGCSATIEPGEPVEIVPRRSFHGLKTVGWPSYWNGKIKPILGAYGHVAICAGCSKKRDEDRLSRYDRRHHDRGQCECCGRPIRGHIGWVVKACSIHCLRTLYRRRLKRPAEPIPCAVCGRPFTPHRSDAKVCGSACRQKAYRQRVTDKGCIPRGA
jgi:hypothetical protein